MTMNEGEVRKVGIDVISLVKESFIIEAADYRISKLDGTEIDFGSATIDGHKILTLFSGQARGQYNCEFIYHIGSEILKAKVYVEVV